MEGSPGFTALLLKITHKALYDDTWPGYLRLKFHTVSAHNLRSLEAPKLAIPAESGTFQDLAARSILLLFPSRLLLASPLLNKYLYKYFKVSLNFDRCL